VAVELVSIGRTEELWVLDENLTKGGKTVLEHDHALVSLDAVNGQLAAAGYVALSTKAEPVVPSELFSIGPEGESLEVLKAVDDGDEYFNSLQSARLASQCFWTPTWHFKPGFTLLRGTFWWR